MADSEDEGVIETRCPNWRRIIKIEITLTAENKKTKQFYIEKGSWIYESAVCTERILIKFGI